MRLLLDRFNSGPYKLEEPALLRAPVTALALFSFIMPWATLDGSSSSISAAGLIAMAFTGPETPLMMDVALLPTMVLLSTPILMVALAVYLAVRNLAHAYPVAPAAAALFIATVFTFTTGPITSSDTPQLFGTPLPHFGFVTFMVCQALLGAHSLFTPEGHQS